MDDRDMTEAGREWMAGGIPAHEYFAMVRRSARGPSLWERGPGLWERLVRRVKGGHHDPR